MNSEMVFRGIAYAIMGVALLFIIILLVHCHKENFNKRQSTKQYNRSSALSTAIVEITTWGAHGTQPGQFIKPRVPVVDDAHKWVYVVDSAGRIQKFTFDGEYLLEWRTPLTELGKPEAMGIDKQGRLIVCDTHYHRVLIYTSDGKLLAQWGRLGDAPGEFVFPSGAVADADGYIYIAQYGGKRDRIQKFSSDGKFILQWGQRGRAPGEFQRPGGMAIDSRGFLYVADIVNHRIQKFTRDGKFVTAFGKPGRKLGELTYPYGIAITPDDRIFVIEYGNNRIQEFTTAGKPVRIIGKAGKQPGEFAGPWGIAVSRDGFLFVADTYNHRIQRLKLRTSKRVPVVKY
ncbi:MAG TPA: hypothetical protein EYP10_03240 [Armatimonadetes bacterium]|nr:hypothetical protein [Armatimonadota bacterium]